MITNENMGICRLLQLTSPSLPIGAYSYSEGIEYLCHNQTIQVEADLYNWLIRELKYGFITNEAAIALRAHQAMLIGDRQGLLYWNNWLSASRETEEIRLSSWQMGQSLIKLWQQLSSSSCDQSLHLNSESTSLAPQQIIDLLPMAKDNELGNGCNYAIAFGLVAASWEISAGDTALGYLHSWLANLVSAAVRSVPFGQTIGQQVIFRLHSQVINHAQLACDRLDQDLEWCGWGASLASTNHEVQYSRLFRS